MILTYLNQSSRSAEQTAVTRQQHGCSVFLWVNWLSKLNPQQDILILFYSSFPPADR